MKVNENCWKYISVKYLYTLIFILQLVRRYDRSSIQNINSGKVKRHMGILTEYIQS